MRDRATGGGSGPGKAAGEGDVAGALAVYGKSLEVRRRLAEADPSNAGWQRDLSVSQDNMGNVLRDHGDVAGALAAYGKSLEVEATAGLGRSPRTRVGNGTSVSHNKWARCCGNRRCAGAMVVYGKSLEVRRRLAEADPSNAGWQRDQSLSLTLIAECHERNGDSIGGLRFAEESLAMDERLAALDRSNVIWQRDVAYSRAFAARLRG